MKRGAAVLCGGRSSRMGRPKALLPWRGWTMIEHVVRVLREAVDEVLVVGSDALDLPELGVRVVRDREPFLGPLAGIREALEASRSDLVYVTGTDVPFLTAEFARAVLAFGDEDPPRAAAPVVDGFVQTLAAAYPARLAKTAAELLEARRLRPLFLLEASGYRAIEARELPGLEPLRGFNTPAAYLEAVRAAAGPDARATVELLGVARVHGGTDRVETGIGTLAEVLREVDSRLERLALLEGDAVARPFLVSLDGRQFLEDLSVPIGPGDRVLVLDAAAGG